MDIVNILIGIGVFALFLVIIIFIIIKNNKKSETHQENKNIKEEEIPSLDELIKIAKDKNSSLSDLKKALLIFSDHYKIDEDNLNKSVTFLSFVLTHKNRDKTLFDIVHKEIKRNNKDYKDVIDKIEMKAM